PEHLNQHGDGLVLVDVQDQGGQQVVVPDPHGLQNGHGDHGGAQQGEYDVEVGLQGIAPVDHGGLLHVDGHAAHEPAEHEYRQPRAEAQVDHPQGPGGVQVQGVRHGGEGEHDHLEGDHHGEGAQQVQHLGDLVVDPGDVPGEHGAADED